MSYCFPFIIPSPVSQLLHHMDSYNSYCSGTQNSAFPGALYCSCSLTYDFIIFSRKLGTPYINPHCSTHVLQFRYLIELSLLQLVLNSVQFHLPFSFLHPLLSTLSLTSFPQELLNSFSPALGMPPTFNRPVRSKLGVRFC